MKIRIYYEDTDCGNVVYYANYLRYFERARTEYLREKGLDLEAFHKEGTVFVVAEVNCQYRKSAHYNDVINVDTKIVDLTSVTMVFENTVTNQHNEMLTVGTTKLVCVSAENGRAIRIPKGFMDVLKRCI